MKKNNNYPLIGQILKSVANKIGAKVFIEPKWKRVGQIVFKNGRKAYFKYTSLDLNHMGASEISKDKDYANLFLKRMGYPIIPDSKTFFSDDFCKTIKAPNRDIQAAYLHALKIGFPVIIKPNSKSQGVGVSLVNNKGDFFKAMKLAFKEDRVVIVQRLVKGKDYRIVVLDGKVISAYQRIPLNVIGDGKLSIKELLEKKQRQFLKSGRHTQIDINDTRILNNLKRKKLKIESILKKGEVVFLLDNANLSTGGDSIDVTDSVHPDFKKIVIKLTKDMGLRLCGVDIMVSGDIKNQPSKWWVIETNSAPGLDHYANQGKKQKRIVEDLYTMILKKIEKSFSN